MATAVGRFWHGSGHFRFLRAASSAAMRKPLFFDMVHSNNAARIRIWIKLKGLTEAIDSRMIAYVDLQSEEFREVNPLKKVPAFINEKGDPIYESAVILNYLEDKFAATGPSFKPATAEERALVDFLCQTHDLYIASPNCTQPGFAHTQGAMYLAPHATKWCLPERAMDKATRAAKLAEIWKQLSLLEAKVVGPYLAGDKLTIADMTWYPTCIFMEFMLPRVFKWPEVFHEDKHFPKLTAWFGLVSANEAFAATREDIWKYWVEKEKEGQFDSIRGELSDANFKWVYP